MNISVCDVGLFSERERECEHLCEREREREHPLRTAMRTAPCEREREHEQPAVCEQFANSPLRTRTRTRTPYANANANTLCEQLCEHPMRT